MYQHLHLRAQRALSAGARYVVSQRYQGHVCNLDFERRFHLWLYTVSHEQLRLRSNRSEADGDRI